MSPKRIFIIEDDSMLQGVLTERFTEDGYIVNSFSNASPAFEFMKEERPDVILTDLVLPNMDGFEILKNIKESIHLNTIPVLIMSNSGQEGDSEKAASLGASDFIVKSNTSLDEIISRTKKVISDLG